LRPQKGGADGAIASMLSSLFRESGKPSKAIVDVIRQLMNGMSQSKNDRYGPKKQIGFRPV